MHNCMCMTSSLHAWWHHMQYSFPMEHDGIRKSCMVWECKWFQLHASLFKLWGKQGMAEELILKIVSVIMSLYIASFYFRSRSLLIALHLSIASSLVCAAQVQITVAQRGHQPCWTPSTEGITIQYNYIEVCHTDLYRNGPPISSTGDWVVSQQLLMYQLHLRLNLKSVF